MAIVSVTRQREWWGFHKRILIELDGKLVGGVWNGRHIKIDVPAGTHTFQAFMGWIGSKPLEVEVRQDKSAALCVRAPWQDAAAASGIYRPIGPAAYMMGTPDQGLEIWESPKAPE